MVAVGYPEVFLVDGGDRQVIAARQPDLRGGGRRCGRRPGCGFIATWRSNFMLEGDDRQVVAARQPDLLVCAMCRGSSCRLAGQALGCGGSAGSRSEQSTIHAAASIEASSIREMASMS